MSIAKGTRFGPYEVLGQIGAGGMGEVYSANDTQLKREVALKVLPEQFARDPERLARFRREAQLLASLNHPNIAAIYGLEESGPRPSLVMEYVPGETLADQIRRGPVEMDEALRIASQITEALEHAHEKTVVHRDLKPANVKVTPQGQVKVLDFGLAKAFAGESAAGSAPPVPTPAIDSNSPTLSKLPEGFAGANASPTIPGVILGTAAYMSPEQAKGKTVDRRTDIWALGCVLYELLTGKQVFSGESVTEILGAVMRGEPEWAALPADTPPGIRAVLRRCLQKDAAERLRDAADLRIQIADARAAALAAPVGATARAPRRLLLLAGLACVVAAAVGGIAVWALRRAPAGSQQVSRSVIPLPADESLAGTRAPVVALSPDGTQLAYVAGGGAAGLPQIYLRSMDSAEARPITGTENATDPFFSPDGQWIGFFAASNLKKISVSGGAALTLSPASNNSRGAAWGPGDTIVFAPINTVGLSTVSGAGGAAQELTKLKQGESSHRWPQFLPDGKSVLFTIGTASQGSYQDAQIVAMRLDTGEQKILIRGGTYGRYVSTGHLVYYRAGTLMAVPFDPVRLEVNGTPAPVLEGVMSSTGDTGAGQFSFSNLGSLAYVSGGVSSADMNLVWVDRKGAMEVLPAPPHAYGIQKLSPDGKRVLESFDGSVWIYDLSRDTMTKMTFEGTASNNGWTPDGKRIIFRSNQHGGALNLYWKPADGSGAEERLTTSQYDQLPGSFTPDGKFFLFHEIDPKTNYDIWVLPMEGERKPRVFLQTPAYEGNARLSPDGRWLSYGSDESGRFEVYVTPYPGPGGKWQISTDGGVEQMWSPDGKEIFYRTGSRREKFMVVDVQTQPTFSAGKPRLMFEGIYGSSIGIGNTYSVSLDGKRFLMTRPVAEQQSALTQINLIQNWFEELRRRVPAAK
ncbi:MAG: serine/threonine-protein kinase [Acidobacteria bacterium]|nr:serine/threonine-protein kinase [Acidobacteriota bacterium]